MSYPFNEEDETVVLMGCPTGGAQGCECEWCQVMGPTPAPRPRTPTGPQPSAAYLERIAAAGAEGRPLTAARYQPCRCGYCTGAKRRGEWCARCGEVRIEPPVSAESLAVCAACDAEVAREAVEEQAP